jgi:Ca2+-binding EF-hand superfamily protein
MPNAVDHRTAPATQLRQSAATTAGPATTPATQAQREVRGMSYEEGRRHLAPPPPQTQTGPSFLPDLFARIDANGDKGIDRAEVIRHLKNCGIGGGLLGIIHSTAADKFIEKLDTNGDKRVTWAEFQGVAQQVLPATIFDEQGNVRPELVAQVYAELDKNQNGGVTLDELKAGAAKQVPADTTMRNTVIDIAGRLGLDALDTNRNGLIEKLELEAAARSVAELRTAGDGARQAGR